MCKPKVRSFTLSLVVVFLLSCIAALGWAAESRRDRDRDDSSNQQSASADRSRSAEPASRAREPRRAPDNFARRETFPRANPPAAAPARPQAPASRYEGRSPSPYPSQPRNSYNPYTRYRTQPRESEARPADGDRASDRTYRTSPYRDETPSSDRSSGWTRWRQPYSRTDQEQPSRRSYRWGDQNQEQPAQPERHTYRTEPYPAPRTRTAEPARRGWSAPAARPQANRPAPVAQQGRRLSVPEARFRGPEADRAVRVVDPRQQERARLSFRNQVRDWNRNRPALQQGHLVRDVVGNPVPTNARFVQRTTISRISINYTRVSARLGTPNNYYVFMPRYPGDYWSGYWDGYRDGWWDGRAHVPHRHPVVISFFYGFYWSDPLWFGFYYPGYYPSIYHYWGWTPGWIYPARCYTDPDDYVYVPPATPYRYYTPGYYVDQRGSDAAIDDIREAWMDGDMGLIANHLTDQLDIQVYFDGQYNYTTSTDDYYAMTADTLSTTQTVSMDFDDPIWLSPAEVFYTGRHVFYDPDGNEQTVYISYRMRHLGEGWYIVAVGSSLDPIVSHYHDFRYN